MAGSKIKKNTGSQRITSIVFQLVLLHAVFMLQVQANHSASGYPICDEDEYFDEEKGICLSEDCRKNCSDVNSPICASNGHTYNNTCEFKKEKCLHQEDWLIIYHEPCVTLPPPPVNRCKKHQQKFFDTPLDEYNKKCDYTDLNQKASGGTLTLKDLIPCYDPRCHGDKYEKLQCSYNVPNLCWCSGPDGVGQESTLSEGLTEEDCNHRNKCLSGGVEYDDGTLFIPESGCGLCECLNGEIACFEDYIPSVCGKLNSSQLEKLKSELVQLFYFQYSHKGHVLIDIRHIHQHPTIISESLKETVLRWKFNYYDRNGNHALSPGERWIFRKDIDTFIHCSNFFDHVIELINTDSKDHIVLSEWEAFFKLSSQPMKRSASLRKPARRNKFRYVII